MTTPEVTVAVLNHRRPHLLARVLTGVLQLDYPAFEIVVVGDRPTLSDHGLPDRLARAVRYLSCADANICRARNIAVAAAAGEVVAFCDDDAVPEPDWLARLVAPFAMHDLGAAGGCVRAADGIEREWQGGLFDRAGTEYPLAGSAPIQLFSAAEQIARGRFLALRGVNSAFRREALHAVGGFDEAFHYFLDETDMALRLAEAGWAAALVRGAEVQHQPEANVARGRLRQPRDLFEVAASKAHFCHRHLSADRVGAELSQFRRARLRELDPYLRLGLLRMADRDRLERRLDEGLAAGLERLAVLPLPAKGGARAFAPVEPTAGRLRLALVTGWGPVRIARLRALARRLAEAGHAVSCFSYLTGPQAAEVRFRDGVWLHRGGTWRPDGAGGRIPGRAARARAEIARLGARRGFDAVLRLGEPDPAGAAAVALPGLRASLAVEPVAGAAVTPAEIAAVLRRLLSQDLSAPAPEAGSRALHDTPGWGAPAASRGASVSGAPALPGGLAGGSAA